ncbi:MAG TPA: ferrous iron transport protein B [Candidatus Acidoferrales bacterium]|nr:ferrous iron transport protein B [Candidatus Acidoferrales bacterium]
MKSCHTTKETKADYSPTHVLKTSSLLKKQESPPKKIALMGNPSAGKSAMFSQMTGVTVIISNIPQTTVMVQQGLSQINGHKVLIYDLPGVYSVTAATEDEAATKEFLISTPLDAVIDIVDATRLERNLYLTLQLLELGLPIVVALNQVDLLKTLDLDIDVDGLEKELGAKVVPTIATQGEGVHATLEAAYNLAPAKRKTTYRKIDYDDHVERAFEEIIPLLPETSVPKRGFAARLLEGDKDFESKVDESTLKIVKGLRDEVQQAHNEDIAVTIARGRHSTADLIATAVLVKKIHKPTFAEKFGDIATRPRTGYPLLFLLVGGMLALIFYVGGFLSDLITAFFEDTVFPPIYGIINAQIVNVFITSAIKSTLLAIAAAAAIAIPYILVFFIFLAILEDVGYLPRVATLLDRQAHLLGLHGRSLIPLLFGYGCSVPAIMATRALPTKKERIITTILITMIPCSARSAIILGVAATYAGVPYALAIYLISLVLIVASGRMLKSVVPGRTAGLVLEIPLIRRPALVPIIKKTWLRMKEFLYIAIPLLIAGSIIFGWLDLTGFSRLIEGPMTPITVGVLGLPAFTAICLIYGVLRKEMAIEMLAIASGTFIFSTVMTPVQIFVFCLVVTLYIPCLATFSVVVRELNWRWAVGGSIFTIVLALIVGGAARWAFTLV